MCFSDRTQLEKVFPSSSKIRAIYAFVRDSLREDVKPIKFILCMYSSVHPSIHPSRVLLVSGRTHTSLLLFPPPEPPYHTIASNPPPRDLKVSDPTVRDLTLGELGLAPSSILHLRFVDDDGLNRAFPFSFYVSTSSSSIQNGLD